MTRPRTIAIVLAGLALGLALRLAVGAAAEGKSFSDNAIVALMAMHALRGKLYAFYWGQSYMGSLEAIVVAPFFALFGVRDLTLSAGLLPWYALYAVSCFAIARRLGGDLAGALALVLAALAPSDVQFFEVTARGGYPATIAFGTLLFWLSLRWIVDPLSARARTIHLAAIGFVAGVAFWTNGLVLAYLVVCAVMLLRHDPALPLRPAAWLAVVLFLVGSFPLWIFNLRHGFPTFSLVDVPFAPSVVTSLLWSFTLGVPNMLGVRDLHGVWAFGPAGMLAAALIAIACVAGLARVRKADPVVFLWLLALATIAIYVGCLPSRFQIGRYLLPITTSATLLGALGLAALWERRPAAAGLALLLLVGFYGAGTVKLARDFAAPSGRYTAGPVDELVPRLEKAGIRFAYASYADAAIATYIAEERVVVADYEERYYPLDEVDFRDPALVVTEQEQRADTSLEAVAARFSTRTIPGYRVYWPIRYDGIPRRPLSRDGWRVIATEDADDVARMLDGDPWSSWSAPPAADSPTITIDFGRERTVTGVHIALGSLKKDGFHRLRVEASAAGGAWRLVKEATWDFPVHFRGDGQLTVMPDDVQMVLFPPETARALRLQLLEGHAGRNWTIAELGVFGVGDEARPFREPAYGDPRSPALAEPRLLREIRRDPPTNRPFVDLARVYTELRDDRRRLEIERRENDRFTPRTLLDWRFGRAIRLLGFDASVVGPRELEITYYWRADRAMQNAYAMSAHFEGPAFRFQDDFVLGAPVNTTDGWRSGEVVRENRRITVPAEAPAGRYALEVGVWDPASGERLRRGGWLGAKRSELLRLDVTAAGLEVGRR